MSTKIVKQNFAVWEETCGCESRILHILELSKCLKYPKGIELLSDHNKAELYALCYEVTHCNHWIKTALPTEESRYMWCTNWLNRHTASCMSLQSKALASAGS